MTGHGRFVEDVVWPDTWHVAFLRSPVARGRIVGLDVEAARALDGVRVVLTAAELNPLVRSWWQTAVGPDAPQPPRRLLAAEDVRWVGEPIAMVLATSRYVAEDALELIELDVEEQPPVIADHLDRWKVEGEVGLVHPELGTNVAAQVPSPDRGMPMGNAALDDVLGTAPHVFDETFHQHRYLCVPMEARGILARWDPYRGRMEIVAATQGAHEVRASTARLLGIDETQVHASAEDVGGGFGQKMYMSTEDHCVVAAAYREECAVRWIEDRNENLVAGGHARTEDMRLQVATDETGRILGIKAHHVEDVGAFPTPGVGSNAKLAAAYLPGPYDIGQYFFSGVATYSNTNGKCAYRGPWMMETVAREQMMDIVAVELGIDPLEFRRHNMITSDRLPFTTSSGMVYETVTPRETLDQVAELIDYEGFRAEQAAARADGRLLGIGLAAYIEGSPGFGVLGAEQVSLRIDYDGKVLASTGSGSHGQSVETTVAQVVADSLGVDYEDVRVVQNDTAASPFGSGTGGSRTAAVFGGAARLAGEKLRRKVLRVAAVALEADPEDLELDLGVVRVKGAPAVALPMAQVAAMAYAGHAAFPPDLEPGLEAAHRIKAPTFMFSNAAHAAVVEVDPGTGQVRVLRYAVSEDCGNMINPMVVEGQIAGGVVQGIGGVFYEHFVYDSTGNPLTTTFMDYLLPTAADVPEIVYGHVVTPSTTPGGFKPVGEGGAIVSPPALINAVRDALRPFGARLTAQPLTPAVLLDIIEGNTR
ncbi:carbon-monoxide dehydrogenase large subunit [Pseudonocardia oroxyli]|uniref:Carbon-monoxide dehydrogenase large subunit n=1 Tax=Pseudonocardia oroxyli TaxID=366584 RepID=A0A1G8D8V3_PSEOR|nr:carbon-monoxide dehydrogenase large subunit [Pseudonocardia oroxyli]